MIVPKGAWKDKDGTWWEKPRPSGKSRRLHILTCKSCGSSFAGEHAKRKCCSSRCAGFQREGLTYHTSKRGKSGAGYMAVWIPADHFLASMRDKTNGRVLEHRYVMATALNRPLTKHEQVHHINGIRDDNRLENLELWSGSHPAGKRVEDLLKWAHEIIDLYEGPAQRG